MPSTVIRRFDYSPQGRELIVEFVTGRRYVYLDVPEEEVGAMRAAFAKGRYFNVHIRDRYAFRELTGGNAPIANLDRNSGTAPPRIRSLRCNNISGDHHGRQRPRSRHSGTHDHRRDRR